MFKSREMSVDIENLHIKELVIDFTLLGCLLIFLLDLPLDLLLLVLDLIKPLEILEGVRPQFFGDHLSEQQGLFLNIRRNF